jgi:hypothetical protein
MGFFSSSDRDARQHLTEARDRLDRETAAGRRSGRRGETDAWNDANDAVAAAEVALPWWKRLGA